MPDVSRFDLDFRPRSYWGPQSLKTHFEARITGELRRRALVGAEEGTPLDPAEVVSSLDQQERAFRSAIHPAFMGGEYLPKLRPNEIEIARVTLKSTTTDVVSIRARHLKDRIAYRIRDEYDDQGAGEGYTLRPKTSRLPLTMRELIRLIDGALPGGLVGFWRDLNVEGGSDPAEMVDFARASSAFYPQLAEWYRQVNEDWYRENWAPEKEDEDEFERG